jgi:hypothetical protein
VTRSLVFAGLMIAATPAFTHADPTCAVSIVRAPDDVRTVVESWLAKEQCATPLTVRIIETDGGYYIYAVDDRGAIRERVVPDAQSAGVLIASWTADDGIVRIEPVAAVVHDEPVAETSTTTPTTLVDHLPAVKRVPSTRWVTLAGGAGGSNGTRGIRGELEFVHAGAFSLDLQLAYGAADMLASDNYQTYFSHFDDLSALIGLHYTWRFHRDWHVRAGFAVGIMTTQMTLTSTNTSFASNPQLATAVSEASLMFGHSLGDRWELEIGPVATLANEDWQMSAQMETLVRAPGSVVGFVGLRRSL